MVLLDLDNEAPGYHYYGRPDMGKLGNNWLLSYEVGSSALTTLRIATFSNDLQTMVTSSTLTESLYSNLYAPGSSRTHEMASNCSVGVRIVYGESEKIIVEKLSADVGWSGQICGGGYNTSIAVAGSNNDVYVSWTNNHKIYVSVNGSEPQFVADGYFSKMRADSDGNVLLFYSTFAAGISGYKIYGIQLN